MYVYLLHFDTPISERHTCQHYIGWCKSITHRMEVHEKGKGARLTAVALERGIGWQLAAYWFGGRDLERRLKNRKNAPRICPICNPQKDKTPCLPK